MIKKSVYIRGFSDKQRKQLEQVQAETKIKTVSEMLLYTLENYTDQRKEVERLTRIIAYKQAKIERLSN